MVSLNTMRGVLAFWCSISQTLLLVCCLPAEGPRKYSISITECPVSCSPPSERTPFVKVVNNPVPFQEVYCLLPPQNSSKVCVLNVSRILQRLPLKSGLSQLDFYLQCQSPVRVVFLRPEHFTKFDVISSLDVRGFCEVTPKDLSTWGQASHLWMLSLIDVVVREEKNQTVADLQGLFDVNKLVLQSLAIKGIPQMFRSFVWEKMAEVQLINMSLTHIPEVLQRTMPNLQSLILLSNRLHKPPDFPWCKARLELPRNLSRTAFRNDGYSEEATVNPRVYRRFFSVDFNPGLDVSEYEFVAGSLDKLSLRGNGLQFVNPTIFDEISELQTIDLSLNKLEQIPAQIFGKASSLVDISLANNRLNLLSEKTFRESRQLRRLDLSYNVMHTFQSGLLKDLANIEEINLKNNSLKTIDLGALRFRSNSLKRINLQGNYLDHIPKDTFLASNLELFDMSDNIVNQRSFWKGVDALDLNDFTLIHAEYLGSLDKKCPSQEKPSKKIITLDGNNIERFGVTQLSKARSLKLHWILKVYTLNIRNNPLTCDCLADNLQRAVWSWIKNNKEINIAQFNSWLCHYPEELRGAKFLSIRQEQLKCETQHPKCPVPCKCYKRPAGLPIFADCRNRSLTELPDEVPEGSIELRLEYNQIQNLTFHSSLRNVTSLHVSHNRLQYISSNSFNSSKLNKIFLNSNQLTTLPEVFRSLNLSKIDIRNNFFPCDCRNKWMKTWLPSVDHTLVGGAQSVSCSSGKSPGKLLISVMDDDFICSLRNTLQYVRKTGPPTTLPYVLAGLLFIFIIASGLIFRFRGELKLLLFTHFSWHPFDRFDDSDPSKIYDAFVSYSSHDRAWVLNTLREKLENEDPCYQLCIHDRDFLVGAPIFQNIFDSVKTSRRMILVLSKSFIRSEWCMLEFRAAHRKVLRDRTNYLIIVLFDDVDIKTLDEELKLYLRTNTYLSVDNKWFWKQLRYALPQHNVGRSRARSLTEETVA